MSKVIPTAEEFLNQEKFNPDFDITFEEYHGDTITWTTQKAMIEFAKLHVEAALKEAAEKAIKDNIIDNCDDHTPYYGACQSCGRYHNFKILTSDEDKIQNSILNSYPLTNIK
jgi:hypothetical protein